MSPYDRKTFMIAQKQMCKTLSASLYQFKGSLCVFNYSTTQKSE